MMEQKIKDLIASLEKNYDCENEFYLTYCCGENDGDISDWYDSHFDDNIARGFRTGEISMAHEMICALTEILNKGKE